MTITIDMIKQLREITGAGIMDCRSALIEANEDYGKALGYLREKGVAAVEKRANRETTQGIVELYSHGCGRVGVMVEINIETDFAARSETFRVFAHEIALQIAASSPRYVRDEDIPVSVIEQESKKAEERAHQEGKTEKLVPRIVEGYLKKYKDMNVLMRQPYIRDEQITIQQLLNQTLTAIGENIVIRRFVRWEMGEEL